MSPLALVATIVLTIVTLLVLLEGSLTFLGSTVFTINEGVPHVRVKGICLPIATWLRYRRWPLLVRQQAEPTIETSASRPTSAPELLIPLVNTSAVFRFVFITVLLVAIGLSVVGQYWLVQTVGQSLMGWALLAGGAGLFVLADYLYRSQIFKDRPKAGTTHPRISILTPFRLALVGMDLIGMWKVRALAGDGWIMSINPLIVLGVGCVALGLVVAGFYRVETKESRELSSELGGDWSQQERLAVLLLFVFAFLVRRLSIGTIPWCFFNDEGSTGLTALEMLRGNLNNLFGIGWYGFPALFFLVPAAFIAIGGPTVEAVRTPAALAGALTVVATNLGRHLQSYPAGAHVYFFVSPYMQWAGFPELTYLAPKAVGEDVKDVLTAPPDWPLDSQHTVFVFVPERQAEEAFVEQRYPGGALRWFYGQQGQPIFLLYELDSP